jgi:hypothetical protein
VRGVIFKPSKYQQCLQAILLYYLSNTKAVTWLCYKCKVFSQIMIAA